MVPIPAFSRKGMSTGYYMYTYVRDDFLAASFPYLTKINKHDGGLSRRQQQHCPPHARR